MSYQQDGEAMWLEGGFNTRTPAQSRNWMFVVWPDNFEQTTEWIEDNLNAGTSCGGRKSNEIVAIRVQEEVSASGKTHLQGFIQLKEKCRKGAIQDLLWYRNVAILPSLVPEAAYNYCCKDDTRPDGWWEHEDGDPLFPAQKMSMAATAREAQKNEAKMEKHEGMKQIIRESSSKEVAQNRCMDYDIDLYKKHFNDFWVYIRNEEHIATVEAHIERFTKMEYNPWQRALDEALQVKADTRKIEVIISKHGDVGKSHFINMYRARHPKESVVEMSFGKGNDMNNLLYENLQGHNEAKVIFVDCTRFMADKANLGVIESIKNGKVINHKYQTGSYTFLHSPHIVLFTNNDFDWEQMSMDRWRIWRLEPSVDQLAKLKVDQDEGTHFAELWKDCTYRVMSLHQYRGGYYESSAPAAAPAGADYAPQTFPVAEEDKWVRINKGKRPHQWSEEIAVGDLFKRHMAVKRSKLDD